MQGFLQVRRESPFFFFSLGVSDEDLCRFFKRSSVDATEVGFG